MSDSRGIRRITRAEAHAAAKVKVTVDKKLGKTTPQWIKELAKTRIE